MPIYLYEVVPTGEILEIEHPASEPALTRHPETGRPIHKVFTVPNIGTRCGSEYSKNLLSDSSLAKSGFTKYVRDPLTKRYNRTVGNIGPAQLRPRG
jgi:predicted nucleic acid-binding Zn ribbon protein